MVRKAVSRMDEVDRAASARASQAMAPTFAEADARAIEQATEMFLARGISSVKMTDIADAAGMGVATLYRHFSTKTAIAAASGMQLWGHLAADYERMTAEDSYLRLDGAGRLRLLLESYCVEYLHRPGFAPFLDELDHLMQEGAVAPETIEAYAAAVQSPYPHYERAYLLGREDGSIGRETDFGLFYRTVAHALLSVAGKLSRGEVLPTDDFSAPQAELDCLVDIAIRSLASA